VGESVWGEWWDDLPVFDDTAADIVRWLVETGHLESDGGMLFIGPEAERRYGRRNFMELLAVFTAAPEFVVLQGVRRLAARTPSCLCARWMVPAFSPWGDWHGV